jgi:hypothetical protein
MIRLQTLFNTSKKLAQIWLKISSFKPLKFLQKNLHHKTEVVLKCLPYGIISIQKGFIFDKYLNNDFSF